MGRLLLLLRRVEAEHGSAQGCADHIGNDLLVGPVLLRAFRASGGRARPASPLRRSWTTCSTGRRPERR
ncbi:hypothetical protein ACFZA1_07985 [Streptomyces filipinensis]|uniref:hypothetical protein n=1 Tax=Streptomyces filipinensis TaxID=66887 RepID=UPI000A7FA93D